MSLNSHGVQSAFVGKPKGIRRLEFGDLFIKLCDALPMPAWLAASLVGLLGFLLGYYFSFQFGILYLEGDRVGFLQDRVGLSHFFVHVPILLSAYYYATKGIITLFWSLLGSGHLRRDNSRKDSLSLLQFQNKLEKAFAKKGWIVFHIALTTVSISYFKDFMLPKNVALLQYPFFYYATMSIFAILMFMSYLVVQRVFTALVYLASAFREFELGPFGLAAATAGIEALSNFSRTLVFWVVLVGIGLLSNDVLTSLFRTDDAQYLGFGLDLVVMWIIYFLGGLLVILGPLYCVHIGIQKWKAGKLDLLSKRFERNLNRGGRKYSELLLASNEVSRLSSWPIRQTQVSQFFSVLGPLAVNLIIRYIS